MNFLKIKLIVIAVIMFAASSAFAALGYDVTVNTSSLINQEGYLYFQYTPVNAVDSTVTLSNFKMDGSGLHAIPTSQSSSVTGHLFSSVTFANAPTELNDYNHGVNGFSNDIKFHLEFASNSLGAPAGGSSTFSLGLFRDVNGQTPLFNVSGINYSVPGTLFTIDLNNDGTTAFQTLANEATVTPTPIPAAAWLLGSGLMGLVGIRRKMVL
ncbi:MAG: hypothetical protein FD174_1615 [Geobacteraceae bacterium]|nr:MAG: hypothetical protein FD174_1615 [Geobacteraceae bacterium]